MYAVILPEGYLVRVARLAGVDPLSLALDLVPLLLLEVQLWGGGEEREGEGIEGRRHGASRGHLNIFVQQVARIVEIVQKGGGGGKQFGTATRWAECHLIQWTISSYRGNAIERGVQ